jgi:hypothetical protein
MNAPFVIVHTKKKRLTPPFFVERARTDYWNLQITLANTSKAKLPAT